MAPTSYVLFSVIFAAVIHIGAAAGPTDRSSAAIEARYVTGSVIRAVYLFALWGLLLYVAVGAGNWWVPMLFAIPGAAALRFSVLNLVRVRA